MKKILLTNTTFYNIECWAKNKNSNNKLTCKEEENTGCSYALGKLKIKNSS